jgi:hypothetical protein
VKDHWSYCVDAPSFLRCYRNKAQAIKSAKSRARREGSRGQQIFVEKVKTNRAGVHNQYAKGAKIVWISK